MSEIPYKLPFHFQSHADGTISILGHEDVDVITVEDQHRTAELTDRWARELQLPYFQEEFDALARHRDISRPFSDRHVQFVICDSGETRLVGNLTFDPARMALPAPLVPLTLGHWSYVVGMVSNFIVVYPAFRDAFAQAGIVIPPDVQGTCMIGTARLFDSGLADKSWAGLQWGSIRHVCAITCMGLPGAPPFDTILAAIALAPPEAGNPRARVLKHWT